MKQYRMSAAFNLHSCSKEDVNRYIRTGLEFYKEVGFDAIDFGTTALGIDSDDWRPQAEQALKDCEEVGIRFEMGHLPFVVGGAKSDEFMQTFNRKMFNAMDAAAPKTAGTFSSAFSIRIISSMALPVKVRIPNRI